MTASRRTIGAVATTLSLFALFACADAGAPSGWIPERGTVSGVITPSAPFTPPSLSLVGQTAMLSAASRMSSLASSASLHRLQRRGPGASRRAAVRNDLIVTFRPTAFGPTAVSAPAQLGTQEALALAQAVRAHLAAAMPAGARVIGVSPAILAARILVADTTQRDAVATALRRDPAVATVTRNWYVWLDQTDRAFRQAAPATIAAAGAGAGAAPGERTPNDPFYPFQSWHYGLIDLPRAWSITQGSSGVLVAVVDEGIRFDHPAIAPNLTSDGYDFVNAADSLVLCSGGKLGNAGDGDGPDPDPTTPASYSPNVVTLGGDTTTTCFVPYILGAHGLHVAGTIGALGNDGLGVTGVNWNVRIRPVRVVGVAGFGTVYDVAQGVLYAAGLPADNGSGGTVRASTGANIINLSLGAPGDDPTLHNAVIGAAGTGALIVAAAGNDGASIPSYPAAYPEVLAVAAVGPDGAPAPYSNFGSYVDIRAPGGNFAFGDATDGVLSTAWDFGTNQPIYAFAEGTSMAAPHVSGVAALVLAQRPGLSAVDLRSRLTNYAAGSASPYGAGLVNAYNSLMQRLGPPTQLYARLYAAPTGAIAQTVEADGAGSFAFTQVPDGAYFLYAGTSDSGEQRLGSPGSLWGPFGQSGVPSLFTVLGGKAQQFSFTIGNPIQLNPNHTIGTASPLMIGGYRQGAIIDTLTLDVYSVQIPKAETYTFETSGWVGACGYALEDATVIGLFNSGGTFLMSADFVDPGHLNFCSRLTTALSAGTYYVAIAGSFGGGWFGGRYRIQARVGP